MEYTTVDIVAMVLILLGPLALLIGGALFIYRHREQWRRENSD